MPPELIGQIASTGIVGVFCALALLMLWQKDKQATAEMKSRIEDGERFTQLAMSIQKEVIIAVQALTKIADSLEQREAEKERLQQELRKQDEARARLEAELTSRQRQLPGIGGFRDDDDPKKTGPHPPERRTR